MKAGASQEHTRETMPAWALAIGDMATFVVFAVIGLVNHDEGVTWAGIVRNVIPITIAWFAFAFFLDTYRDPSTRTLVRTWSLAIPAGVIARAIALKRDADGSQLAFGIVAALTTLILLLAWRRVAALISKRAG
jgi:hypothetical protein